MTDPMGRGAGEDEVPTPNRGRDVRLVATGVAVVLLGWFAVANLQSVRIRFWVTSAHAPVVVVIAISGVLGAGVWALVARVAKRRGGSDAGAGPPGP